MKVELPLYVGASNEHLAKGAAILGQTSIPVGEIDTNSVIAGHRGYQGAPFFREIEKLNKGDTVTIVNPWDTLEYEVTGINVISPFDTDAVMIQDATLTVAEVSTDTSFTVQEKEQSLQKRETKAISY